MDQEAADELSRGEVHGLHAISAFDAVVFPPECHSFDICADEAMVGDRHTVRVSAQICQHDLGPTEGWLGINDPVDFAQGREVGSEDIRVSQLCQITEEGQFACAMQSQ